MRGLLERVESLLSSDSDPQVVANCLYVMQQVGAAAGLGLWVRFGCRALCRGLGLGGLLPRDTPRGPAMHAAAVSRVPAFTAHAAGAPTGRCPTPQAGQLEGRVTRQLVVSLLNHIRSFRHAAGLRLPPCSSVDAAVAVYAAALLLAPNLLSPATLARASSLRPPCPPNPWRRRALRPPPLPAATGRSASFWSWSPTTARPQRRSGSTSWRQAVVGGSCVRVSVFLVKATRGIDGAPACMQLTRIQCGVPGATRASPAPLPARRLPWQVLDFGLNHRNSAVVMATAKLFLHYTLAFAAQHQQVGRGGCCQGAAGALLGCCWDAARPWACGR